MLLESCDEQIARDVADGRAYIPAALATAIQAHIAIFAPAVTRAMNMRGQRSVEVEEKQTAVSELERYVRDYWNVLEWRIARENPLGAPMPTTSAALKSGTGLSLKEKRPLLKKLTPSPPNPNHRFNDQKTGFCQKPVFLPYNRPSYRLTVLPPRGTIFV